MIKIFSLAIALIGLSFPAMAETTLPADTNAEVEVTKQTPPVADKTPEEEKTDEKKIEQATPSEAVPPQPYNMKEDFKERAEDFQNKMKNKPEAAK